MSEDKFGKAITTFYQTFSATLKPALLRNYPPLHGIYRTAKGTLLVFAIF